MPTVYKILGQTSPTTNANTTLYTVPTANSAVISTLTITNLSNTVATNFRVAARPSGATLNTQHFIAYDVGINASDSLYLTLGITLASNDSIIVSTPAVNNLAFSAFGSEIY